MVLYRLAIDPKVGYRWRLRGAVPPPEGFEQCLWQGVLSQFVILRKRTGEFVGHVVAYNADLNGGHVSVGVAARPEVHGHGIAMEGLVLFLRVLFDAYSLRKVYFEVPEYNLFQFRGAIRKYLVEEGRLRDHDYFGGRYWDTFFFGATREVVENVPLLRWRRDKATSQPSPGAPRLPETQPGLPS